jgi:hypothetical protein
MEAKPETDLTQSVYAPVPDDGQWDAYHRAPPAQDNYVTCAESPASSDNYITTTEEPPVESDNNYITTAEESSAGNSSMTVQEAGTNYIANAESDFQGSEDNYLANADESTAEINYTVQADNARADAGKAAGREVLSSEAAPRLPANKSGPSPLPDLPRFDRCEVFAGSDDTGIENVFVASGAGAGARL